MPDRTEEAARVAHETTRSFRQLMGENSGWARPWTRLSESDREACVAFVRTLQTNHALSAEEISERIQEDSFKEFLLPSMKNQSDNDAIALEIFRLVVGKMLDLA